MFKMKQIITVGLLFFTMLVYAQQDPMFTQYMTNPVSINPAIAGSREVANLTSIYRNQWASIEGAPTTISLTYDDSFGEEDKVGFGVSVINDVVGPVNQTGFYTDYAYHIFMDKDRKLSFGLMGGFNYYQFDLISLRVNSIDDDIPIDGYQNKFLPNFGTGVFYYTPDYFMGVSVPKLLRNSLEDRDNTLTGANREERHFFFMTGALIDLNEDLKLKPSTIFRFVGGAPINFDANLTLMIQEKIWIGAVYRFRNSLGGMVRWQLNDKLHLGYSYDFSTSRINNFSSGTHEIFISFDFIKKGEERTFRQRFF